MKRAEDIEGMASGNPYTMAGCEVVLQIDLQMSGGIGTAVGIPTLKTKGMSVPSKRIAESLYEQAAALPAGQSAKETGAALGLTAAELATVGIVALGPDGDRSPYQPIPLLAKEVFRRGSHRLDGPWERLLFPDIALPDYRSGWKNGAAHFDFLRKWGLAGGIIGSAEATDRAVSVFLRKLVRSVPEVRVLLIGENRTFGRLALPAHVVTHSFLGKGNAEIGDISCGITTATPKGIGKTPQLMDASWDLICVLDVDEVIKSTMSVLYSHIRNTTAKVVFCTCQNEHFLTKDTSRTAIAHLLRLPFFRQGDEGFTYHFRNIELPPPILPEPYAYRQGRAKKLTWSDYSELLYRNELPLCLSYGGGEGKRTVHWNDPDDQDHKVFYSILHHYSNDNVLQLFESHYFASLARRYAHYGHFVVKSIPFRAAAPAYHAMTAEQLQFYFYWRSQTRSGNWLAADDDYVRLLAFELINGIGVCSAQDAADQLRTLWMRYRTQNDRLDFDLFQWLVDYSALYVQDADIPALHAEALRLGANGYNVDVALHSLIATGDWSEPLPENVIAHYSAHPFRLHALYDRDGYAPWFQSVLPSLFSVLLRNMQGTKTKALQNILHPEQTQRIERQPFAGVPHPGATTKITVVEVPFYSRHKPWTDFVTGAVKYVTNELRVRIGQQSRLKVDIPPAVADLLAAFDFSAYPLPAPAPAPSTIQDATPIAVQAHTVVETIAAPVDAVAAPVDLIFDKALIRRLVAVSDQVQEMLLADTAVEVGDECAVEMSFDGETQKKAVEARTEKGVKQLMLERADRCIPAPHVQAWHSFLSALAESHIEALVALSAENAVHRKDSLQRIARANATMPALLVDAINEVALETLGDLLIDPEPPHAASVESRDILRLFSTININE